jgi:hypothetical protein
MVTNLDTGVQRHRPSDSCCGNNTNKSYLRWFSWMDSTWQYLPLLCFLTTSSVWRGQEDICLFFLRKMKKQGLHRENDDFMETFINSQKLHPQSKWSSTVSSESLILPHSIDRFQIEYQGPFMSIIMRTSSRESSDEYLLPVWVIVWIEKLCSHVTLSIHCTPDVEMVFPYYSVFHCSLCSTPVFHWFLKLLHPFELSNDLSTNCCPVNDDTQYNPRHHESTTIPRSYTRSTWS